MEIHTDVGYQKKKHHKQQVVHPSLMKTYNNNNSFWVKTMPSAVSIAAFLLLFKLHKLKHILWKFHKTSIYHKIKLRLHEVVFQAIRKKEYIAKKNCNGNWKIDKKIIRIYRSPGIRKKSHDHYLMYCANTCPFSSMSGLPCH